MKEARRREIGLAVVLAAIAGYLDVLGFIVLGGQFVSFMSGNTTEFATFLGTGALAGAGSAAVLIGMFVVGVMVGAVAARFGDSRTTVLSVTTVLVVVTAAASGVVDAATAVAVGLPTAMGAMNATFLKQGEVSIGLTYMTGALVKAGQQFVDAVAGGPRWLWLRSLSLWLALAIGGLLGALTHGLTGVAGTIWIAAGVLAAVTTVTSVVRKRSGRFGSDSSVVRHREVPVLGESSGLEGIS